MKDLYWRLFTAWHALFEAPSREETIQHERDRAHDVQQQLVERYRVGYLTGYMDAVEEAKRQREMV
jgi:hypothetical protein